MNGAAIVDASVVLKWYVSEDDSSAALKFVRQHRFGLSAPTLLLTEFANALWKSWRRSLISAEDADHAIVEVQGFFSRLIPTETLLPQALRLSRTLDHPVYDCCYLALAANEDSPLVSADARLIKAVAGTAYATRVVPLSNWS